MIDMLPNVNKSIQDLSLGKVLFFIKSLIEQGSSEVETISEKEMAYTAFQKMVDKSYSALGVVNSDGALVGNISINDLKVTIETYFF